MKVNSEQIQEAAESLREMGARRIILFGSMIDSPKDANDIDIAVEGIPLNQILNADVAQLRIRDHRHQDVFDSDRRKQNSIGD